MVSPKAPTVRSLAPRVRAPRRLPGLPLLLAVGCGLLLGARTAAAGAASILVKSSTRAEHFHGDVFDAVVARALELSMHEHPQNAGTEGPCGWIHVRRENT